MIKIKVAFLGGTAFSANRSFLKTFQIALIGWIKAGLPALAPNKPILF